MMSDETTFDFALTLPRPRPSGSGKKAKTTPKQLEIGFQEVTDEETDELLQGMLEDAASEGDRWLEEEIAKLMQHDALMAELKVAEDGADGGDDGDDGGGHEGGGCGGGDKDTRVNTEKQTRFEEMRSKDPKAPLPPPPPAQPAGEVPDLNTGSDWDAAFGGWCFAVEESRLSLETCARSNAAPATRELGWEGKSVKSLSLLLRSDSVVYVTWVEVAQGIGRLVELDEQNCVKKSSPFYVQKDYFLDAKIIRAALGIRMQNARPAMPPDILRLVKMYEAALLSQSVANVETVGEYESLMLMGHGEPCWLCCKAGALGSTFVCALCLLRSHPTCSNRLVDEFQERKRSLPQRSFSIPRLFTSRPCLNDCCPCLCCVVRDAVVAAPPSTGPRIILRLDT